MLPLIIKEYMDNVKLSPQVLTSFAHLCSLEFAVLENDLVALTLLGAER